MKKKFLLSAFSLCLLVLLLCGGVALLPFSAQAYADEAPSLLLFPDGSRHSPDETELDLSAFSEQDVLASIELLRQMPDLRYVNLGYAFPLVEQEEKTEDTEGRIHVSTILVAEDLAYTEQSPRLSWDAVGQVQTACPETQVDYHFRLFGQDLSTLVEALDFNHIKMKDEGAAVKAVLPYMQNCKSLDMDFCYVSSPAMAEIRDAYPDMHVVWRIWFGHNCSVRTDVERVLASNLDHVLVDDNTQEMKYLTELKYIDIGHNDHLHDFSFMEYMPDLEVAIICITGLQDLNYISKCTKLWYLEINTLLPLGVDLSPLASLTNLEHLNICYNGKVTGYESLEKLTNLKRLWIGTNTYIPEEYIEHLREALPNTTINTTEPSGAGGSWRQIPGGYDPAYAQIRKIFDYDHYTTANSTFWNDPLYGSPFFEH